MKCQCQLIYCEPTICTCGLINVRQALNIITTPVCEWLDMNLQVIMTLPAATIEIVLIMATTSSELTTLSVSPCY